jgi:ABC-2 type transport system ATP-binding protein
MNEPIIAVNDLSKVFQLKQQQTGFWGRVTSLFAPTMHSVVAVDAISFSVQPGACLAFIGPNGAGKSTVIKMLAGIMTASDGTVRVLGLDPAEHRQKLAYHIGTVFGQRSQLWYHLCPLDTYNLLSRLYELDRKAYEDRLNFLVQSFDIGDLLKTPVRKLSLGQRMRCEIVASLLHRPKVIFLDEPTIGLDVIAKEQIRDVIRFLNHEEKVTIFLTSHDAGDIEALAQRTIVINHGRLIFDDSTERLKTNFITTKVVELVAEQSIAAFAFEGGKIVERSKHSIKIELDPTKVSLDALMSYALGAFNIKDINIYDPPMEQIIAHIYQTDASHDNQKNS